MTVALRPEVEHWLHHTASESGSTPNDFVAHMLERLWLQSEKITRDVLLRQATTGMSEEFWNRYAPLLQKVEQKSLTESERADFLSLHQEVEEKNVLRMYALSHLARLDGIPLDDVMRRYGIGSLQVGEMTP